jgi:hypothetical protein
MVDLNAYQSSMLPDEKMAMAAAGMTRINTLAG